MITMFILVVATGAFFLVRNQWVFNVRGKWIDSWQTVPDFDAAHRQFQKISYSRMCLTFWNWSNDIKDWT